MASQPTTKKKSSSPSREQTSKASPYDCPHYPKTYQPSNAEPDERVTRANMLADGLAAGNAPENQLSPTGAHSTVGRQP